jgi:hypothetical protein
LTSANQILARVRHCPSHFGTPGRAIWIDNDGEETRRLWIPGRSLCSIFCSCRALLAVLGPCKRVELSPGLRTRTWCCYDGRGFLRMSITKLIIMSDESDSNPIRLAWSIDESSSKHVNVVTVECLEELRASLEAAPDLLLLFFRAVATRNASGRAPRPALLSWRRFHSPVHRFPSPPNQSTLHLDRS